MMQEEFAARAALLLAIAGIASVAFLDHILTPEETPISEINDSMLGKNITVKGMVEWRKEKNNTIVFGLNDGSRINCVAFGKDKELYKKTRPRSFVIVEGRVEKHDGEKNIVAKKVYEWNR